MSPKEIEVGKAYHNGKVGPRSYSERKVLEMNVTTHWNGGGRTDCVRYEQTAGAYKGKVNFLPINSFAKWARGTKEEGC